MKNTCIIKTCVLCPSKRKNLGRRRFGRMAIVSVTITDECTGCGLCETTCEEVFELNDVASVKADVDLNAYEDMIMQAVDECPVEAIEVEKG
jgi:ferredoxin